MKGFVADWLDVVSLHFRVDPELLGRFVPFELDAHHGEAYVSLVGFTLKGMRTACLPGIGRMALRALSDHEFLNLRTYVRVHGETGIYFLAEWLNKRLAVPLGRPAYGLPYRFGKICYEHSSADRLRGEISSQGCRLSYRGCVRGGCRVCDEGSLDAFLLERYTAFTAHRGVRRVFRVRHEPWPCAEADIQIEHDDLTRLCGGWRDSAEFCGAHWSPGVPNVEMSFPERLGAS